MSLTIHSKYKYFDSTVQRVEDRWQKFHFCRLPFAVNVMLNLSNVRGVLVLEGYDYSSHIVSRQSSRSLQWLLVSNSRVYKGIHGGVDTVARVVQT